MLVLQFPSSLIIFYSSPLSTFKITLYLKKLALFYFLLASVVYLQKSQIICPNISVVGIHLKSLFEPSSCLIYLILFPKNFGDRAIYVRALPTYLYSTTCLLFSCVFMFKLDRNSPNLWIFWKSFDCFGQSWCCLLFVLHFALQLYRHNIKLFTLWHSLDCFVQKCSWFWSMLVFKLKIYDIFPNR